MPDAAMPDPEDNTHSNQILVAEPKLELFGARTGNSMRVAVALEEAGLPYVIHSVDLRRGEHETEAFLALNPSGKVPVLIDRTGGQELIIAQSNAIMIHLAETAPPRLMPFTAARDRALFYQRLFYFITDVIAPNHSAFFLKGAGVDTGFHILSQRAILHLEAAERFLDDGPFMAGNEFSLVDIAAVTIAAASTGAIDWGTLPRLGQWFDRVMSRPAVIRGMHAFGG